MTLAENTAFLKETGQYDAMVARLQQQDEERGKREAEWRCAEEPLVRELRAAGFMVESAWDLVNTPGTYPAAVPILFEHLPRPYPAAVRECIARALAVPDARVGWDLLTRLYSAEPAGRAKDGLAVAIAAAAHDDVVAELIALVQDDRQGPSRLLLLRALERSKNPEARAALMRLQTDTQLREEVEVILRRIGRRRRSRRDDGG